MNSIAKLVDGGIEGMDNVYVVFTNISTEKLGNLAGGGGGAPEQVLQRTSGQILKGDMNGFSLLRFKDDVNGFHPPRIFSSDDNSIVERSQSSLLELFHGHASF